MKERDFSVRARRTTRVALRVPVRISTRDAFGSPEMLTAWTVVVNTYGARFQCKRPLQVHDEVAITNLSTGRAATGIVIWANTRPDRDGYFEFAIELHTPTNLWHLSFPPQDWEEAKKLAAAQPAGGVPADGQPEEESASQLIPQAQTEDEIAMPAGPKQVSGPPEQIMQPESNPLPDFPLAPDTAPPSDNHISESSAEVPAEVPEQEEQVDLTEEIAAASAPAQETSTAQTTDESVQADTALAEPSPDSTEAAPAAAESASAQKETADVPGPPAGAEAPQAAPAATSAVEPLQHREPAPPQESRLTATDRLTEVLQEMVESTLLRNLEAESERVVHDLEGRFADIQTGVLSRLGEQAASVISEQRALLEEKAAQLQEQGGKIVAEQLRGLAEAGNTGSKRVREEAEQAVSSALDNLSQRIGEQVPVLEEQFVHQCRDQTQQLLTQTLDGARRAISDQIDEVANKIAQHGKTLISLVDQLEQRAAKTLAETSTRLESQMAASAKSLFSTSAEQFFAGLRESQKHILEQAERRIAVSSEKSLLEVRKGIARALREVSETMTGGQEVSRGAEGQGESGENQANQQTNPS